MDSTIVLQMIEKIERKFEMNTIRINLQPGLFGFQTEDMQLIEARPEIAILVGPDGQHVSLKPTGTPNLLKSERLTPIGRATDYTWRWKKVQGFCFSWSISVFEDVPGFSLRADVTNTSNDSIRIKEIVLCRSENHSLLCKGDAAQWWLSTLCQTTRTGNLKNI